MELHELENSLDKSLIFKDYKEAVSILETNGFKVITPFKAKKVFLDIVKSKELAHRFHLFNPYQQNTDTELMDIYKSFNKIVLKDNRSGISSFQTLNGYLRYRSGCFYNWYYPNGTPKF